MNIAIPKENPITLVFRRIGRALLAVVLVLFLCPFPLITAAITLWLLGHLAGGFYSVHVQHSEWTAGGWPSILGCVLCVSTFALVAFLALAHLAIMVLAAWKGNGAATSDAPRRIQYQRPGEGTRPSPQPPTPFFPIP